MRRRTSARAIVAALAGTTALIAAPAPGVETPQKPETPDVPERHAVLTRAASAPGAYAIPKLLVTRAGTALVVAQDRTGGDWASPIDPILVRSDDGGRTWSEPRVLMQDAASPRRFHLKPTGIVEDRVRGRILVFISRSPLVNAEGAPIQERWFYSNLQETRRLGGAWFLIRSDDDGVTWSEPRDITSELIKVRHWQEWSPVHVGIQLRHGAQAGRLLVPCRIYCPDSDPSPHDLRFQTNGLLISDDGGVTWTPGPRSGPFHGECSIVERRDGAVYVNHRQSGGRPDLRTFSISRDGGTSFETHGVHADLPDQKCHAGLARLEATDGGTGVDGAAASTLVLSSVPGPRRRGLTASVSTDGGATWSARGVIEPGHAAYSSLAVLADGTLLCVYETGATTSRRDLVAARFDRAWLQDDTAASP